MSTFPFSMTDIGLFILIGIFAFWGWRGGLIKMGFRLLSFLASIILAWLFHPVFADFLRNTAIYGSILNNVSLTNAAGESSATAPNALQEALSGATNEVSQLISQYLADLVLNIIAFVLLLILIKIAILILSKVLHLFASLPVIGFFNHAAGLVLGFLEGTLIAFVILAAIYVFVPTLENPTVNGYIENSVVTKTLYYNNPLIQIVLPDAIIQNTELYN